MNPKKRTQEKIKFSKLRLQSSSNKSGKSCSSRPQEKISSYFSSALNESEMNEHLENTSKDLSDTIVKGQRNKTCLSKINTKISFELNTDSDTPDDINDFTKPKIIKVTKKLENKPSHFENLTRNVGKRKNQFVSKTDNLKNDSNQEHLQLAIAMSKSIMDLENPQNVQSVENSYPSTQQKLSRVKQTLDQFGFKSDKWLNQPSSKTNVKLTKGKKFKYYTPSLFLRTEADRTKLIENKVSQIINNISIYNNTIQEKNVVPTNNTENKPRSFILRDYYKEEPILFNKNALCISGAQESIFYNNVIQPSNVKVGVLLKDWLTIPGREATPPLEENISHNKNEEPVNILQVPSPEISMSPELFADSDDDDTMEQNEKINNSNIRVLNSSDSITQIDKEKNIESYSSTKSVSLLDNIKANNKNTSVVCTSTSRTETLSLSLSPFPNNTKTLNINTRKQIKCKTNLEDKSNENSDSLSPFDSEYIAINKSKRNVTPKKKTSPNKYVVTPKGRKIISPNLQKTHSSCRKSILFTEKQDIGTTHNDDKNSEICHFESFCNDSIECFDLTHSSDDEHLELENVNKNDTTHNTSFTITQLLNELSPVKSKVNKENTNEVQSSHDSQASIETIKLKISENKYSNLNEEYSPEFDCINISNNKVFYETFNNSSVSNNDDCMAFSEKSSNSATKKGAQNVIDLSNSYVIDNKNYDSKINDNRQTCSSTTNVKNIERSATKTPLLNDEIEHSFMSPNSIMDKKRNKSKLRKSYSESFIYVNKIQNESTPRIKYFSLSTTDRKLSQSVDEIEKSYLNFNNDNICLSQSSISTCSDISDEELNYSCNSIYKRYNLSNKALSISDEENDRLTSATENENNSIFNLHLQEPLNYNSASENIHKSLQHPRVLKLSTPLKVLKTAHEPNHCYHQEEKGTPSWINIATPKTDIVINAENITPKGHYTDMDTPERNLELEKFGLKPMKRNKGVKILHYIYDSTHPYLNESDDVKILNNSSDDENGKAAKRRKTRNNEEIASINITRNNNTHFFESYSENANQIAESETIENMIFERKQSTKISSCRLPLHVAWNNLLINSKELQETILTYTPIQVEEIYEQLKHLGYKFHIQDIVAFLDKKCITIRIAQSNRHQKKVNSKK